MISANSQTLGFWLMMAALRGRRLGHTLRSEPIRNAILQALPDDEFAAIQTYLSRVQLVTNQILNEPGERSEHAYFIENGIVSIRDTTLPNSPIQVALIGREGIVGSEGLLQLDEPAFSSASIQQPGSAIRIPMRKLADMLEFCPSLKTSCMMAVISLIKQVTETAASNARDSLAQRCIRLLLMIHDRIEGEEVQITHEALSVMLGVRRSGITLVATDLQGEGLVRINRGRITILNRSGLERQLPKSTVRTLGTGSRQDFAGSTHV